MSAFERSTLLISLLALIVNTVVFVLLWVQVRLLRQQNVESAEAVERDHEQRRIAETMRYYTDAFILTGSGDASTNREWTYVNDRIAGRSPTAPGNLDEIRDRLRLFEVFATGVNLGAFSFDVADRATGSSFLAAWLTYRDLIYVQRERMGSPRLYEEFESLAQLLMVTNRAFWERISTTSSPEWD